MCCDAAACCRYRLVPALPLIPCPAMRPLPCAKTQGKAAAALQRRRQRNAFWKGNRRTAGCLRACTQHLVGFEPASFNPFQCQLQFLFSLWVHHTAPACPPPINAPASRAAARVALRDAIFSPPVPPHVIQLRQKPRKHHIRAIVRLFCIHWRCGCARVRQRLPRHH